MRLSFRRYILEAAKGRTRFNAGCPLCAKRRHRADTKHALWVDLEKNWYRCYRCDAAGHVHPPGKPDWAPVEQHEIVAATVPFPSEYQDLKVATGRLSPYQHYARKRHIPENLWDQLHVGFCDTGKYSGRLILPIINNSKLEGWVARSIMQSSRPYLYPPGMSRGSTLFNLDRVGQKQNTPLLVVEGWLDAVFLWPHAVAVLGMPSTWQLEQLTKAIDPVVFVLDGDAWRTGETLSWRLQLEGKVAGYVKLPPTLDPDDLAPQDIVSQAIQSVHRR